MLWFPFTFWNHVWRSSVNNTGTVSQKLGSCPPSHSFMKWLYEDSQNWAHDWVSHMSLEWSTIKLWIHDCSQHNKKQQKMWSKLKKVPTLSNANMRIRNGFFTPGCPRYVPKAALLYFHSHGYSATWASLYPLPDYHTAGCTWSLAQNHPGVATVKNIRLRFNRLFFLQLGIMDYHSTQKRK